MFWTYLTTLLLLISGCFLMLIVLVQRGRGGGLAGAFGGLGGQSAFGTKAGDVFTKVTIGVAIFWVIMAGVTGFAMRSDAQGRFAGGSDVGPEDPTLSSPGDESADEADPFDGVIAPEEDAAGEQPSADEPASETETDAASDSSEPASDESAPSEDDASENPPE